jgi:hypothetical protein
MNPTLHSMCIGILQLSAVCRRNMFTLFDEYFCNTTPQTFEHDLSNKHWVILLSDEAGQLQGFSTFALYETKHNGAPISVVCSGDTIVRPAFWGTPQLPRSWIQSVLRLSQNMPQPLYWLLISSGYKTYRFLSVFYREFYPRHDAPMPPNLQSLMNQLAHERFGNQYNPQAGTVRFAHGNTPLRDGIAAMTEERLSDPHVRFFAQRNRGHAQGDELVCLTRIAPDNFTAAGRRMVR